MQRINTLICYVKKFRCILPMNISNVITFPKAILLIYKNVCSFSFSSTENSRYSDSCFVFVLFFYSFIFHLNINATTEETSDQNIRCASVIHAFIKDKYVYSSFFFYEKLKEKIIIINSYKERNKNVKNV